MAIKGGFTAHSVKSMLVGENCDKVDGLRRDPACVGLYLWVRGNGKYRAYQYRFNKGGKEYTISLGAIGKTTLEVARAKAREHTAVLQEGGNPALKQVVAIATTFTEDTQTYYDFKVGTWTEDHAKNWMGLMNNHVLPHIGEMDTAAISTKDLAEKVMLRIWGKLSKAPVVLDMISCVLKHAMRNDDDQRFVHGNVADRVLSRLPEGVQPVETQRASLAWENVPAFYAALQARPEQAARALQLLLLCQTPRAAEIIGMKWAEIDTTLFFGPVWHVPGDRMKAKKLEKPFRDRDIPLCQAALDLLGGIRPINCKREAFVFEGRQGKWVGQQVTVVDGKRQCSAGTYVPFSGAMHCDAMQALIRDMGYDFTVHGMRATFRSWVTAHAKSVIDHDAAEIALGHKIGTKVHRAYDRADLLSERRDLAERWSEFLLNRPVALKLAA